MSFCTDGTKAEGRYLHAEQQNKGIGMAKICIDHIESTVLFWLSVLTDVEWEFVARAGSIRDLPATKG